MCLPVREQRLLDRIGETVSRSDPRLASMLATFGHLTAGEAMPGREQLRAPGGRMREAPHAAATAAAGLIARAAGKRSRRAQQAQSAAPPARRRNGQQPDQPDPSHARGIQENTMRLSPPPSPLPPDPMPQARCSPLPPDPIPQARCSPLPPGPARIPATQEHPGQRTPAAARRRRRHWHAADPRSPIPPATHR